MFSLDKQTSKQKNPVFVSSPFLLYPLFLSLTHSLIQIKAFCPFLIHSLALSTLSSSLPLAQIKMLPPSLTFYSLAQMKVFTLLLLLPSLTRSLTSSLTHSLEQMKAFSLSLTCFPSSLLLPCLSHVFNYLLAEMKAFPPSLPPSLTYSLTHSLTHSLTPVVLCFSVTISGLTPDAEYQVVIYALNGVSDQDIALKEGQDKVFRTEAASEYWWLNGLKYLYSGMIPMQNTIPTIQ